LLSLSFLVSPAVSCGQSTQALDAGDRSRVVACNRDQDQAAILAMAGAYQVQFDFEETTALIPGYSLRPASHSSATELILVIEEAPGWVSLQHVLVIGDADSEQPSHVVKHWRQDWRFQDLELLEFQGHRSWRRRTLSSEETRCSWTQAVFEVDDSPRYEGYARWYHGAAGSEWRSHETWRPLPRREYTKRSDYDILVGVNLHRIAASGWEHEQENVKLVLEPRHALVREHGLNHYAKIDADKTQLAREYWERTGAFWRGVRAEWRRILTHTPLLTLELEVSGKRLYEHLFERASQASTTAESSEAEQAFIRDTIARYVKEPSTHGSPSFGAEQSLLHSLH
jgi:hypothetical protein